MHSGPTENGTLASPSSNGGTTSNARVPPAAAAAAAAGESVEELLERVLDIQAEYADRPVHSYEDFLKLIRTCDLKPFTRAGPLERIYAQEFLPRLKQQYGSTAQFLLKRLDWSSEMIEEAKSTRRYFTRDIEARYIRVRRNDWAYSVPKDYEHWLVWTLLPLVDWTSAAPFVSERGLSGRYSPSRPDLNISAEGNHTESVCYEIIAFAKKHWPDATDFMWLVNPVRLQSVPALAHAHVFVRRTPLPDTA